MLDRFGRKINYLRISVTDRCNLRCLYCRLSDGAHLRADEALMLDEIVAVARAAAAEGIDRVRITGGEPLLRNDLLDLVAALRRLAGIAQITMTTNGLLLAPMAKPLKAAGLSRLNISLDTLQPHRFQSVTGGRLQDVLDGIAQAEAHFDGTKLNVVVMRGVNEDEVGDFGLMTVDRPVEVRFIEHMAMGEKRLAAPQTFVSTGEILETLRRVGPLEAVEHDEKAGPARRFRLQGARGTIGLITPVSEPFCGRCNRLRLTSEGKLRSCLLRGGEVDVRPILRNGGQCEAQLRHALHRAADLKPQWHEGRGEVCMSKVGG